MRADVADRAERPAALGLEPPVPVALEEQPVLEVATGHEPDVAELAGGDDLVGVLVERVVADVEVGGVDEAGRGGQLDQLARLGRGHRQRLLADDVPAGREDGLRLGEVEIVGGGDVDDVDRLVAEEVVEGGVCARDAEAGRTSGAALGRAAEHAADLDADAAERLDVDGPDEARADDRGADVGDPCHEVAHPLALLGCLDGLDGCPTAGPSSGQAPVGSWSDFLRHASYFVMSSAKVVARTGTEYDREVEPAPTDPTDPTAVDPARRFAPLPDEALDALVVVLDEIRFGRSRVALRAGRPGPGSAARSSPSGSAS